MKIKNISTYTWRTSDCVYVPGEQRILDSLGLHIDISKLPTASEYKASCSRYYGTHWLSRIWCRWLRPVIMPTIHEMIKVNFEHAQLEHQQAFAHAILEYYKDSKCISEE